MPRAEPRERFLGLLQLVFLGDGGRGRDEDSRQDKDEYAHGPP